MKGETWVNDKDAYTQWGVVLGNGAVSALMTPAPLKSYVTNDNASMHGKAIANTPSAMPKVDSRTVQLTIYLYASSSAEFYTRYQSFVSELQGGAIRLKTKYQQGVVYRLYYNSCSQFSQYNGRLGKFTISFTEPNPMNRAL